MKVLCYTSFTFSYLNRARTLFDSIKKFHPDWHCVALITDEIPPGMNFDVNQETFDRIVWPEALGIQNLQSWLFKHDVVEVCTAVKGPFLKWACGLDFEAIIYLDPDTCLFNDLNPLISLLEQYDVVLTPHTLEPQDTISAIWDNEITPLWAGTYNLGFVAIRTKGDGLRFADWWAHRLENFCYDKRELGLFVDQKWCDLAPALFDNLKILRDPGYNVASWNLNNRKITIDNDGQIWVNGSYPLRFWHFTKLGATGDAMTERYAKDNFEVYELWRWYRNRVYMNTSKEIPSGYWAFGTYQNSQPIEKVHREIYRDSPSLQAEFPTPRSTEGPSFLAALPGLLRSKGL